MPDFIKSKYFLSFLFKRIRGTAFYVTVQRAITYSRRFFLIGRIIRYIGIAVTVIETSAALIFLSALTLALIPVAVILLLFFFISDLVIGSRLLKSDEVCEYLGRKRIFVISEAGNFGKGLAKELAENGSAVLVVTWDPSMRFISGKMQDGVFYIRHAFYFRLKRKRLSSLSDRLVFLL